MLFEGLKYSSANRVFYIVALPLDWVGRVEYVQCTLLITHTNGISYSQ